MEARTGKKTRWKNMKEEEKYKTVSGKVRVHYFIIRKYRIEEEGGMLKCSDVSKLR